MANELYTIPVAANADTEPITPAYQNNGYTQSAVFSFNILASATPKNCDIIAALDKIKAKLSTNGHVVVSP